MTKTNEVRIYVACLASYNNGTLHGTWIDASDDVDAMRDEINEMLRNSPYPNVEVDCPKCSDSGDLWKETCPECKGTGKVPSAEEYAIHDYEGFGKIKISEYESLEEIAKIAAALEEHGEAFAAAVSWLGDVDDAIQCFEDGNYHGLHDSEEAFAEEIFDDCYLSDVPESVRAYIDYEKFARDLFMGDYASVDSEESRGVHVFRSC